MLDATEADVLVSLSTITGFQRKRSLMTLQSETLREFLLVSDFDQTLSFKDSGQVLSELVGITNFQEKVDRLSQTHLVQQGGELAYLLVHDPDFRKVRREHLREA